MATGVAKETLPTQTRAAHFETDLASAGGIPLLTWHRFEELLAGGDLTDRYFAAVALYAGITFVDKRTMDTFRRMFAKSKELEGLVRDVRRATNYFDALGATRGQAVEYEANRA